MEGKNLVKKTIKKDRKCFEELINLYIDDIYKVAYLKCKHEEDVNKVIEETIYKAYNNTSLLKKSKNFKIFINNMLFKVANDYLNNVGMIDLKHEKNAYIKELNDKENVVIKINLYNVIDELEEEYKDIVILKYMFNLEIEEIISILEIPKEVVINNLQKAINDIEKISFKNEDIEINNKEIDINIIESIVSKLYIDEERINSIKVCNDVDLLVKESLDKGEKEVKKNNKKKYITASIVVLLLIGAYAMISKPSYKVYSTPSSMMVEMGSDEKTVKIPENELESIMLIHKMSNSIIIPKDNKKYGSIDITPKTIEIAINSLEHVKDEKANSYLKEALNSWKNGDFVNGVQVHNYVWHALDGEVGKAGSINDVEVNKIIKTHFK